MQLYAVSSPVEALLWKDIVRSDLNRKEVTQSIFDYQNAQWLATNPAEEEGKKRWSLMARA